MLLIDIFYIFFSILLLPFLAKYIFKSEYIKLLKHRFIPDINYSKKKRIWIHAVSVGEIKSIKTLIEQLTNTYNNRIVLSVTTPAGYEFAKIEYKNIKIINSPFDFSFVIKKFIEKINPGILILNELEVWPNWISIAHKNKIPILLTNGRISDTAFNRYRKYIYLFKKFLNMIDFFLVQSEFSRKKFSQLGIPDYKIKICGNIKADEAFKASNELPSHQEIYNFLKIKTPQKKVITLASSHLSDEKILFPIINKIKKDFSLIIVPRHLTRIDKIEKKLKNKHIKYQLWSKFKEIDINNNVLIFDKIGYLFNILDITHIVLMGGTFDKKIGGHNLYEPAVLGKSIIGGPFYNNFPDIGKELFEDSTYLLINNSQQLLETITNIKKGGFCNINKKKTVKSVLNRKGSTKCISKHIQSLIKS